MVIIILYHVSFDISSSKKYFIPRIPLSKSKYENSSIARICFSDSITRCICAISDVFDKITNSPYIDVFELDVNKNCDKLLSYEQLYNKSYVPDSLFTHEYWYLAPIVLSPIKYKIIDLEVDNYFLVHEQQRADLFTYIDEHYNLPLELITKLSCLSCSEILNNTLYEENFWNYDIDVADIAEYLHCSNLIEISNLRLQLVAS